MPLSKQELQERRVIAKRKKELEVFIKECHLERFLRSSNEIEGEVWKKLPIEAAKFALSLAYNDITSEDICKIHALHGEDLRSQNNVELGKFRVYHVRVGKWIAPHPLEVPELMEDFCKNWKTYDAWKAHNEFELIHPFTDGNGRVGRLLWLIKMQQKEYSLDKDFLKEYYYQTLNHY